MLPLLCHRPAPVSVGCAGCPLRVSKCWEGCAPPVLRPQLLTALAEEGGLLLPFAAERAHESNRRASYRLECILLFS